MRVHYLQHVPFEGLGSIEVWVKEAGYELTRTRFYESSRLPELEFLDLLIIMGGPMGVYDDARFPWLREEKAFIRRAVESGKAVLGICLGAQLIAAALGARVYRNPQKEIGWFPVYGVSSERQETFRFPDEILAFHWHGDTFDLPPKAVHLARSEACTYQAFQVGGTVLGLQFHLETTPGAVRDILDNAREELISAPYIQTESAMLAAAQENCEVANDTLRQVLSFITRLAR
ncbi:MAG: glutamine amidotransferase [Candidatus Hydrogenedentes bacterium ADurb.Bin101]|jgi:GMP synthase-like glutamine amidotransferase|nr:MAG: glutamine amidotransferase [Candidatus Hydrogenedentes bacterium ADurb.Bin101]